MNQTLPKLSQSENKQKLLNNIIFYRHALDASVNTTTNYLNIESHMEGF